MLQNAWQDVRYGFRGLATRPGFTLIAAFTLALGIGSAAAIFSVIQNVLLDPAPYADVERIAYVQIRDVSRSEPGGRTGFQVPSFSTIRNRVRCSKTSSAAASKTHCSRPRTARCSSLPASS